MLRRSSLSLCAVVTLCALAQAESTIYIGSLSTQGGGLTGQGGWASGQVTFGWTVTQNQDQSWHYEYVFDRGSVSGNLSHLIIETSTNLIEGDIMNAVPVIQDGDPQWYKSQGKSNPGLPGAIFGIKFENPVQSSIVTFEFDSPRAPTWGDFYAKDGSVGGSLWNVGFLGQDPIAAPQNGSIDGHVLVPDTTTTATVPAPGAMILSSLGAGLISWLRRRHMV